MADHERDELLALHGIRQRARARLATASRRSTSHHAPSIECGAPLRCCSNTKDHRARWHLDAGYLQSAAGHERDELLAVHGIRQHAPVHLVTASRRSTSHHAPSIACGAPLRCCSNTKDHAHAGISMLGTCDARLTTSELSCLRCMVSGSTHGLAWRQTANAARATMRQASRAARAQMLQQHEGAPRMLAS